ncbi:MAG: hypothetical protein JNL85_04020 [Rubrivivax sp.]|nr:hypothetical protein [Rubrivivax sp.]
MFTVAVLADAGPRLVVLASLPTSAQPCAWLGIARDGMDGMDLLVPRPMTRAARRRCTPVS